ncbi:uncharacterized protein LOC143462604 [Clavelina lepadiformis]|uniref:uncharacterized protein LOC143462604 n=1 Tax=Clavelina lepadiformis TaxID=159417 RepID=UPI004042B522
MTFCLLVQAVKKCEKPPDDFNYFNEDETKDYLKPETECSAGGIKITLESCRLDQLAIVNMFAGNSSRPTHTKGLDRECLPDVSDDDDTIFTVLFNLCGTEIEYSKKSLKYTYTIVLLVNLASDEAGGESADVITRLPRLIVMKFTCVVSKTMILQALDFKLDKRQHEKVRQIWAIFKKRLKFDKRYLPFWFKIHPRWKFRFA